jgi:arylsulfatase A-like enzyme
MKQPNIIMFFCDELRKDALSCYSQISPVIDTPNIERISNRGLTFDECYCASPVCVPSRTSIMTGLLPEETGVYHNEAMFPEFELEKLDTLTSVLEQNNYLTVNFGKTHLAHGVQGFMLDNSDGSQQSFTQQIEQAISPKGKFQSIIGGIDASKEYLPERVTQNALAWLKNYSEEQPYFLRVSYLQPHTPVIVKKGFENHYANESFKLEAADKDQLKLLSTFEQRFSEIIELDTLSEEEITEMRKYYFSLVGWIDQQIGLIMDYLEENDQLEDTIIVFSSDHGANKGAHGWLGKQIFHVHSHAIPLIISYPEKIKKASRTNHLTNTIDFAPILFDLANINEIPAQFKGINTIKEDQEFIYSSIGFGQTASRAFPLKGYGTYTDDSGWPRRACIRTKDYRLDMNCLIDGHKPMDEVQEDVFFVDRRKCPQENRNMKDDEEYSEVVATLKQKLSEHLTSMKTSDPQMLAKIYTQLQKKQ